MASKTLVVTAEADRDMMHTRQATRSNRKNTSSDDANMLRTAYGRTGTVSGESARDRANTVSMPSPLSIALPEEPDAAV
jgi:hypothetical protein